jgi:hypothetical protein
MRESGPSGTTSPWTRWNRVGFHCMMLTPKLRTSHIQPSQ